MQPMFAYLVTNTSNLKQYVGIASDPWMRWQAHQSLARRGKGGLLHRAIRKNGASNFSFEIVACSRSWFDLCQLEQLLIGQYRTYRAGYNLTKGGEGTLGYRRTESEKAAMSAARKGVSRGKRTPDFGEKIRRALKGRSISAEQRAKISATLTGRSRSPEAVVKSANAMKGRRHTEESKAKMSAAQKGRKLSEVQRAKMMGHPVSAATRAAVGAASAARKASPETRAKIGAASRGRKDSEETRLKKAAAGRGRRHSEVTKAKMRSNKACGLSEETRRKMSEAQRARYERLRASLSSPERSK